MAFIPDCYRALHSGLLCNGMLPKSASWCLVTVFGVDSLSETECSIAARQNKMAVPDIVSTRFKWVFFCFVFFCCYSWEAGREEGGKGGWGKRGQGMVEQGVGVERFMWGRVYTKIWLVVFYWFYSIFMYFNATTGYQKYLIEIL